MLQPSLTPLTTRVPSQLDLSGNQLCGLNYSGIEGIYTAEGITAIANALKVTASLTECNVRRNNLDEESATLLAKAASQKRIMLFGIKHDQTEADFQHQSLGPVDAILIASDLSVSASVTELSISGNSIGDEGKHAIGAAVSSSMRRLVCDELDLHADATTLDVTRRSLGPGDAALLAGGLRAFMASLTSVNLLSNNLDTESANLLLKVMAEKPNLRTLCGLTHEETELNLECRGLGPGDAKLLAPEILVMASLTALDARYNGIGSEGEALLQDAVSGRAGFDLEV